MSLLTWGARAYLQYAVLLALLLLAWRRGAAPERILVGTLLSMLLFDRAYHIVTGHQPLLYARVDLGHFLIDAASLVIFVAVAICANRVYPLWIGASQIIAFSSHFYRLLVPRVEGPAYLVMTIMPSYVIMMALTVGLICHSRRRTKLGNYPSWRKSLHHMPGRGGMPLRAG